MLQIISPDLLPFISSIINGSLSSEQPPRSQAVWLQHSTETALLAVTEKLHAAKSSNYHLSSSFWTFQLRLTRSTTRLSCPPSKVLVFVEQHGSVLLPTWTAGHIRYHGKERHMLHADSLLSTQGSELGPLLFSSSHLGKLFPHTGSPTIGMLMTPNLSFPFLPQTPQLLHGSRHVWQT